MSHSILRAGITNLLLLLIVDTYKFGIVQARVFPQISPSSPRVECFHQWCSSCYYYDYCCQLFLWLFYYYIFYCLFIIINIVLLLLLLLLLFPHHTKLL